MSHSFSMGGQTYGPDHTLLIAELSANHNGDYQRAVDIIDAAVEAGADAIKVQTYDADSMTIRSDRDEFQISGGTIWDGQQLHDLYAEASMPWHWQPKLAEYCASKSIHFFSSPFDARSVDFLEEINVPAYKIASFELVDIPLIRKSAQTGKPIIISTGMATETEISDAVQTARKAGAPDIALLKCTSAYPSPPESMNLNTIPILEERFDVTPGLSDHTLGTTVPVAAVALGACVIEKHLTLKRADGGPDSAFSLEPHEFKEMTDAVRTVEKARGTVHFGTTDADASISQYRRSLYATRNIAPGEPFTTDNIRAIRPGLGLPPKHIDNLLGKPAPRALTIGSPLSQEDIP